MKHVVIKNGKEVVIETVDDVPKKRQSRSSGEYFVMMPLTWVERLQAAKRINTYRVALYVRRQHFKLDAQPIKLSNEAPSARPWLAPSDLARPKYCWPDQSVPRIRLVRRGWTAS
jgi:hypothetical protein